MLSLFHWKWVSVLTFHCFETFLNLVQWDSCGGKEEVLKNVIGKSLCQIPFVSYVTEFWFKVHNIQDNFLIGGKLQLSALNCTRLWILLLQNVVMFVCSFPPFFGRLVYRAGRCALLSQTNYFPGYPPAVMAWWSQHPSDEDVLYSALGKPPQH